jgi:DNA repair protein RadC
MRKKEKQADSPSKKECSKAYCHATYAYRISLVKDKRVRFSSKAVTASGIGAEMIRNTNANAGQSDRENLVVLMLNSKNEIIGTNVVSQGSLNRSIMSMREVFKAAIIANAGSIILGHNHPSEHCFPSEDDRVITKTAKEAGRLLGIPVLDHIIVSQDEKYYSFCDHGLMGQDMQGGIDL